MPADLGQTSHVIDVQPSAQHIAEIKTSAQDRAKRFLLATEQAMIAMLRVTTTRCNLGGVRYWWLCPRCGRRCRMLYGGKSFTCRKCNPGAYYETQKNKDLLTRIDNELTAIRRKLKAKKTLAITGRLPDRPRSMHWRTYVPLGKRYNDLQHYRMLSISIDIVHMDEAMGIRIAGSAEDMAYQLKWLMDNK